MKVLTSTENFAFILEYVSRRPLQSFVLTDYAKLVQSQSGRSILAYTSDLENLVLSISRNLTLVVSLESLSLAQLTGETSSHLLAPSKDALHHPP
jgi:hypothetical protein